MIYILLILILIIVFYIINSQIIEHYCKIPKINKQGGLNDKKVLLDYPPQSDISTSSCNEYWKEWPLEYNNDLVDDEPNIIKSDQLKLPKEKEFANNNYTAGLIDFDKLADLINDNIITEEQNDDENSSYILNNKKTWINRWEQYNPSIKNKFEYNEIKSPIEDINILNIEFNNRCNLKQKKLLTNNQLVLFGIIPFDIFKYKILNINNLVYTIQIALYRESDLYINTFSYIGFIKNNIIFITNTKYIGRNSTDTVLLPNFYNPTNITQEIINNNFTNSSKINKDPSAIVKLSKDHQENYKINNQYACFSTNNDLLQYYSREKCESQYNEYGKKKDAGIYDKPCKKNEECPFYKENQNYSNDFGGCQIDGYCELPINMERIGYKYFKNQSSKLPLCYNCNSNKFNSITEINSCCEEQFNKNKYPFLKSPDYSFENDILIRKNYFNSKFCSVKNDSEVTCKDIIL